MFSHCDFFFSAVAVFGFDWKMFRKPSISDPMAFWSWMSRMSAITATPAQIASIRET